MEIFGVPETAPIEVLGVVFAVITVVICDSIVSVHTDFVFWLVDVDVAGHVFVSDGIIPGYDVIELAYSLVAIVV